MANPHGFTMQEIDDWFKIGKETAQKTHILKGSKTKGLEIVIGRQDEEERARRTSRSTTADSTEYASKYIEEEQKFLIQRLDSSSSSLNSSQLNSERNSWYINQLEEASLGSSFGTLADLQSEDNSKVYVNYRCNKVPNSEHLISRYHEDIISSIDNNQVTIIEGITGSGKTTQVPQYILDHYASQLRFCKIIVTQPRRIAAISIAKRLCSERNWVLGDHVGYQVGLDSKISQNTFISYVTTGVLLQKLINTKNMNEYTHVILDEVHERNKDMDFCLLLVRKFLHTNSRNVKVILMSATFDTPLFANYFSTPINGRLEPAVKISVTGKSYEVAVYHLNELQELGEIPEIDPLKPSIDGSLYLLVRKLIDVFDKIEVKEQRESPGTKFARQRGSFLIFLPGLEEINSLHRILSEILTEKRWWIVPLHSSITVEEQSSVFLKPQPGYRKIILSTNIAESSITVPDIKYVIDFCLTKNLVCDPETNYTSLQLEWASKANCKQRKGRAGRVASGRVYRLVPLQFYNDALPEYGIPEMKRCPLEEIVLQVKLLGLNEPKAMLALALEPPKLSDIETTILRLKEVEALTIVKNDEIKPHDGELTFIGRILAKLPLDIRIGKMIALGHVFGCLEECIIIGAGLSIKSIFARPFKARLEAYRNKVAWAFGSFSDCFAILNAYRAWYSNKRNGNFRLQRPSERDWCRRNFIQLNCIREVEKLIEELTERLNQMNIRQSRRRYERSSSDDQTLILKLVICGAFYPNYFLKGELDEREINRSLSGRNPYTTVIINGFPLNEGILYSHTVKRFFEEFAISPKLHFEDSKGYVEFSPSHLKEDRSTNISGKILPAVYLAVKIRQLRIPLEIDLLDVEEAKRRLSHLKLINEQTHTLRTNRISAVSSPLTGILKQAPLPGLDHLTFELEVTWITECGHFWATYSGGHTLDKKKYLQELINGSFEKNLQQITGPIIPNMLCLVEDHEYGSGYHRGRIERVCGSEIEVFLVDIGKCIVVPKSSLRKMDVESFPDLQDIPMQAFECVLSEIKPSPKKCPEGKWSEEATEFFHNLLYHSTLPSRRKKLIALIYSIVNHVVYMELIIHNIDTQAEININSQMKKRGFAITAKESQLSEQNHKLRSLAAAGNLDRNKNEAYEDMLEASLDGWTKVAYPEQPIPAGSSNRKSRLKGPASPLEVAFRGMTRVSSCKQVKVEPDSVNSVMLDPDPQDPNVRMMVASHLTLSPSGGAVVPRGTTLMPDIPGLPSIVALLFSPKAELRTDMRQTYYTGAICGLGYNHDEDQPLFPEHDMEIAFDVVIDETDIHFINRIRIALNSAFGTQSDVFDMGETDLFRLQNRIREHIINLVCRTRNSIDPKVPYHSYQWNKIDADNILRPELHYSEDDDSITVYPLHCGVGLNNNEEIEVLARNFQRMH